jgi:hypothetical protein
MLPPSVINGAFGHQRCGSASELRQRISTDLESGEKSFAAGVEVFTTQRLARSEGDAVNQEIKASELFTNLTEGLVDFFLFRNVTRQ